MPYNGTDNNDYVDGQGLLLALSAALGNLQTSLHFARWHDNSAATTVPPKLRRPVPWHWKTTSRIRTHTRSCVGGFTEYASIVGSKVLFDNKTFKEANKDLDWNDGANIAISAGFGAASGFIDNGISRLTNWIAKPANRKIVTKLLENGIDMVEDALKQYFETDEISTSSMLVGTLTEVGMGNLISEKYVKKALGEATDAVSAAEKRLADLSKRKHPNAKLIHKAQEELNSAKQFQKIIKGLDTGNEIVKKTVSKGVSQEDK